MKTVFQYQGLISENYKKMVRDALPGMNIVFMESNDEEELISQIEDADIFVGYRVTEPLISKAKKLKHIQIPWTGFNNLGKEHLSNLDVTVSNSHANSLAIAEHAFALLTSAAKLITQRDLGMRNDDWSSRYESIDSVWISEKTTAIIGYGAIGKKFAKMMKFGFDNRILAIKRTAEKTDGVAEFIGSTEDLDKVIPDADFILISVPLTSETNNLIDHNVFRMMKKNAVLVNIARGEVVNERALFDALKNKDIHAAGIDVWYNYPRGDQRQIEQNHPFKELDNIVMTPHSAFKIKDREKVFLSDIITNLKLLQEGKAPINQVNLELGY